MTENINNSEAQSQNLTTPEGVKSFLSGSKSEDDCNLRCNQVKSANNGQYPSFWFQVVLSGLAEKTYAKWGGTHQIKIHK